MVEFLFNMVLHEEKISLPVADRGEEVDWREELARKNALDLIQALSDKEIFPCPRVNNLMKNTMRSLETDPDSVLMAGKVDKPRLEIIESGANPPRFNLVVPQKLHRLSGSKGLEVGGVTELMGDLVEAASSFVDRGKRDSWVKSRRREFDEAIEENPIDLKGILR